MTKSTITRERLQEIAEDGFLKHGESKELSRMALAAMDGEAVAYMWDSERKDIDAPGFYRPEHHFFAESNVKQWGGKVIPLYRHVQPAPVVPDEVTAEDCPALVKYDVTEVDEAWARGFNACRAAKLNGGKS